MNTGKLFKWINSGSPIFGMSSEPVSLGMSEGQPSCDRRGGRGEGDKHF